MRSARFLVVILSLLLAKDLAVDSNRSITITQSPFRNSAIPQFRWSTWQLPLNRRSLKV
jgi:hypothetical protein